MKELSDLDTTPRPIRHEPEPVGHIALTSLKRHGRMRAPTDYVHALELAGGAPKVFSTFRPPPGEPLTPTIDITINVDPEDRSPLDGAVGLLLPGGGDVDPDLYGAERHPRTRNVNRRRDRFELTLLTEALERDLPILCVCRGMQLLNVALGGTLEQHLADDPARLEHDRDRPRADHAHAVELPADSLLTDVFGQTSVGVNSHHHQGLATVSSELEHVGWAEDGVLEAVVARDRRWVVGVQWHPEVLASIDHVQVRIFEAFVDATRAYAAEVGIEPAAQSA